MSRALTCRFSGSYNNHQPLGGLPTGSEPNLIKNVTEIGDDPPSRHLGRGIRYSIVAAVQGDLPEAVSAADGRALPVSGNGSSARRPGRHGFPANCMQRRAQISRSPSTCGSWRQNSLAIALEPVGRNTAPALTLGRADAARRRRQAFRKAIPIMLVLPADHVIRDGPKFRALAKYAAEIAQGDSVVTFGIVPDSPNTGYGYIR